MEAKMKPVLEWSDPSRSKNGNVSTARCGDELLMVRKRQGVRDQIVWAVDAYTFCGRIEDAQCKAEERARERARDTLKSLRKQRR